MDSWLYYEIFVSISDANAAAARPHGLSDEGLRRIVLLEKRLSRFYGANKQRVTGLYIFHYYDRADDYRGPAAEHRVELRAGQLVEFIRLRFRVAEADHDWACAAMRDDVLADPALAGVVAGWRRVDGYTARADVGARFGDLEHGVDPTDAVVKILTGNTELRFYLLDHPSFVPNHDIIHLYFNTMGLFYPQEVAALEARAARVKGFMAARA
jgi:hypothetical protein